MADVHQDARKEFLHVQDCRIWAEIHYLDSATDYREHLPQRSLQLRANRIELVMLENSKQSPAADRTGLPWFIVGIIFILISACLLGVIVKEF